MKILISADMEGATGVTWPADVEPGTEQWQRCRRMFTSDVNAAVAGFFDGGATAVIVNDAHATMRNLPLEQLDARAVMLTGRHKELSMVGVPVVLVTGDDRTCTDAAGYGPGVPAVAVKDCVSRYAAVCRPPEVTAAAIRSAAKQGMTLAGRVAPVRADGFRVEVEVDAAQLAQAAAIVPTVRRTGERVVAFESASAFDLVRCFKVVCTMISSAMEQHYG